MNWFLELTSTLDEPRLLHAAVVHYPVVAGTVGPLLLVAYLVASFRDLRCAQALRTAVLIDYATLALAAWIATETGEDARAALGSATAEARAIVEQHRALAEKVTALALTTFFAVAASPRRLRVGLVVVALGCGVTCGAAVSAAGHLGGTAVYRHGAGVTRPVVATAPLAGDPRVAHYLASVRPVLERSCTGCHGPGELAAGGLDLTTADSALIGGERGPGLVPGDPDASLLFQAASWTHETLRMPLGRSRLADSDLEALRRWIADGAVGVGGPSE